MSGGAISPAREAALAALLRVENAGAWSDAALKHIAAQKALTSRDAALASRLCYGVMQNRILLDYYIGCYCSQRPAHLECAVRNVLRLGAYQILYLDKVPVHAAVNDAVEQIRRAGRPKAAGMVNAVLRKLSTERNTLPAIRARDKATYLSITYSHPKWLVERLIAELGEQEAEAYLRTDNEPVPTTVQTNTLHLTPEELRQELIRSGVRAEPHPWLTGCFYLAETGAVERLDAFARGDLTVQDAAARLTALATLDSGQERILDICAAPGGKTFAMAIDRQDRASILACDIHPNKLRLVEAGARRLGLQGIRTAAADGTEHHAAWYRQVDLVLADVPCSGLGIIRKKPDIRYKDPAALSELPHLQSRILENASTYVRPGGVLVYATCTILRAENEAVTDAFLRAHSDFTEESFTLPSPIGTVNGHITLLPHRDGTDGFYICRMRRKP